MGHIHLPTFFITAVVSLIVLFLFVSLRLKMIPDCDFRPQLSKRYAKRARTGDIITVAYGSKRAGLVKVFTGSMWAHSCVVLRPSHGDAYVLEVARYSREERGIMVTELGEWLEKNSHNTMSVSPYLGVDINEEKIKNFLRQHQNVKEEMFVVKWLEAMVKRRYPDEKQLYRKRKLFCSEMVCHFLQQTGVLRKKNHPSGYKPWELLYGAIPLCKGAKYGKPMMLKK